MTTFAPSLHCILAREARVGVVIRRGPSKSVCTLRWDLSSDSFELGQWFRGRILGRLSDISPDGRHFLYFAVKRKWHPEGMGSWTAISRVPYLKALVLLTTRDGWQGGGLFASSTSYWINETDGYRHASIRDHAQFVRDQNFQPADDFGGGCPAVYYNRLLRDGWTLRREPPTGGAHAVFDKAVGQGLILRKFCWAEDGDHDQHALVELQGQVVQDLPHWQWADLDRRRLVWSEGGRLFSAYVRRNGIRDPREHADFSGLRCEARTAPY